MRFLDDVLSCEQTVSWTPGGFWAYTSGRNAKERFAQVNPQEVLDKLSRLPLAERSYISYAQRHLGPMAQDFHALVPLNDHDRMIDGADLDGVALAGAFARLCPPAEVRLERG